MRAILILLVTILCQVSIAQQLYETEIHDSLPDDPDYQLVQSNLVAVNKILDEIASNVKVHPILEQDMTRLIQDVQKGRIELVEVQLDYPYMRKILQEEQISTDTLLALTKQFNSLLNTQLRIESIYTFKRVLGENPILLKPSKGLRKEVRHYHLKDGDRILEIGSGSIQTGAYIGNKIHDAEIYLNDVDPIILKQMYYGLDVIANADYKAINSSNNFHVLRGSKKSTGAEEMTFDKIIIRNAFHHFEYPLAMLRSIKRSMDGHTILIIKETFRKDGKVCCLELLPRGQFKAIMKENGFEQVFSKKLKGYKQGKVVLYKFKLQQ